MSDFLARIKPKRSTVSGETPSSLELEVAEIALNTADGKIFTKHTDGSIKEISGSGGGGGGSIDEIEDIGNVQARQTVSPGVLSWDVKDDENVLGGWKYDDTAFQLSLNKDAKNGFDIRPSVVAMPTTGTIWVSFDNLTYTEIAYTSRVINTEVVVIDLVVTAPNTGFPGEIYVAFDSPYADGPSFDKDILLYDVSENSWIPSPLQVNDAADWDTDSGLQDGMSMVWSLEQQKWTQGFPVLSSGSGLGGETSTAGTQYMVGPNRWFSTEAIDPAAEGWTALGTGVGDDVFFSLFVPSELVGTEFYGQPMPASVYLSSNGNIHWDATQGGSSGGRSGNFVNDSSNRDFWLAFWSQDTASKGVWEKWDGNVWTIRIEFNIAYNQANGCPVEVQWSRNGSLRVSYGTNEGTAINVGVALQGIASDGVALVSGFGAASDLAGQWSWAYVTGTGKGRSTKDLLDVTDDEPQQGQILTFDANELQYKPADPLIKEAPEDGTPYVRQDAGWVSASSDGDVVESVNGETGVVSLGIQDMDDYHKPSEYVFDTFVTPESPNEAGQWTVQSPGLSNNLAFAKEDANGVATSVIKDLPIGSSIWLNGVELTTDANGASFSPGGTVGSWYIGIAEDVSAVDTSGGLTITLEAPVAEGDILQWNDADQKFKLAQLPAGGGGGGIEEAPEDGTPYVRQDADWVSASTGGGGANVLRDLDDVETLQIDPAGFETSFEEGQSLPVEPAGTYNQSVYVDGTRSYLVGPAGQSYGLGAHIKSVFDGNAGPRYDVIRIRIRSDQEFTASNRMSLGGTKDDISAGPGWTVYTRDTGFSLYMNGAFTETGTKPPMLADTWYEVVYVLDWVNGRNSRPAAFSLWVDGAICVDSFASTDSFSSSITPDDTRFYFANSPGTDGGNKFADLLQVKSSEVLSWGMSDTSIDPELFFASSSSPPSVGQVLRYSPGDQEWQPDDFSLANLDDAGFTPGSGEEPSSTLSIADLGTIRFNAFPRPSTERWSMYAIPTYGVAIGKYHLDVENGGTINDERSRDDEARRTYYADKGIMHNLGDKPLWLNGALGAWTDNTPELRWTSGNPLDSSTSNNGNYVGLTLPSVLTENFTYSLPSVAPSSQKYLSGYADGRTEWVDPVILTNTNAFSVTAELLQNFEGDGLDLPPATSNMTTQFPSADAKYGSGGATFSRANQDYFDLPLSSVIGTRLFTFEFWYKSSDTDYSSTSFRRIVAPVSATNDSRGFQVYKRTTTSGKEGFICLDPSGSDELGTTNQAIDDGLWHHVVFQHLGLGTYTTYLDGVEVSRVERSTALDFLPLGGWRVGGREDLSAPAFFEGSIDGMALYLNANKYLTNFNVPNEPPSLELIVAGGSVLTKITELADVDTETTTPLDGEALIWSDVVQNWIPGTPSENPSARRTGSMTAAALGNTASADLQINTVGKSGTFLQVTTNAAAWVRFYVSAASRTADAGRSQTESPTRGSGVLLELITTGSETLAITPAVGYFNLSAIPEAVLYSTVTNLSGATADITVDVNALVTEG